jgi:hypothetical protein
MTQATGAHGAPEHIGAPGAFPFLVHIKCMSLEEEMLRVLRAPVLAGVRVTFAGPSPPGKRGRAAPRNFNQW